MRPVAVATCDLDQLAGARARARRGAVPLRARGRRRGGRGRATRSRASRPAIWSASRSRSPAASAPPAAAATPATASGSSGCRCTGCRWATNYGGFLSDAVRVPFADAMLVPVPEGVDPAAIASLSDNIPDGWRTVAPQLAERPGAPVLICGGAAAIALYAAAIALALGRRARGLRRRQLLHPRARRASSAPTCSTRSSRSASGRTRSPSTRAPTRRASPARCARPSRRGSAPASASTSTETTPMPLLEMYTKGIRFHTGACTPGRRWSRSSSWSAPAPSSPS